MFTTVFYNWSCLLLHIFPVFSGLHVPGDDGHRIERLQKLLLDLQSTPSQSSYCRFYYCNLPLVILLLCLLLYLLLSCRGLHVRGEHGRRVERLEEFFLDL